MDRLISLEPSNLVAVRIEPWKKCYGNLTLRNVMYTMPVAFRLQPANKGRYSFKPLAGIIAPLCSQTVEIVYHPPPGSLLRDSFPFTDDSFFLQSVVAPGVAIKDPTSSFDAVPNDWFTTKKKHVFVDNGIRVMFVGSPVLVQLVMDGSMDKIREVLEHSDPSWNPADSVDSNGETLLHIAIAQSRPDIVQLLLEFQPDVELQSRSCSTPLEAAARCGEELIVELLLAHKASPERSESSSWGPIHQAAAGGYKEVLRLLLLKGANVDALTKDGNTALHLAVVQRRKDCARLLLANGASPDVRNTADGDTPLHVSARSGDEKMVKLLIQKVSMNKDIKNKAGKTAYDIAVDYGHIQLFDALKLGDSLCLAAKNGEARAIESLIENGAVINGRDQNGWTALHRASFKGRTDVVRVLIDNGIDIDSKDEDGYASLHCAVESGHAEVVELLVKKGADVEARTNKGVTALQISDSLHYAGISRILIHGGATADGMPRIAAETPVSTLLGNRKMGKEIETKGASMKKKPSRTRAKRGSFDRSLPLAVI